MAAAYIFGPAIGGFLGQIRLGLPFIVAGIVAAVALVIVIFVLDESLDKKTAQKELALKKKAPKKSCKELFSPIVVMTRASLSGAGVLYVRRVL